MRILSLLVVSILFSCLNLYAQYDAGTVIYSENNSNAIQKNYKIVDFDGDNFADILFIKDGSPNQLSWYKGNGTGNFSEQEKLLEVNKDQIESEIHFVDMNGDGIDDIVFQNSDTGFIILLNDGKGNISEQLENEVTTDEFVGTDLKALDDLDGDGDMDGIFFTKLDNSDFFFWSNTDMHYGYCLIGYNDGSGTLTNYTQLENEQEVLVLVKTGDIDGDGDTDIIFSGNREIVKNAGEGQVTYENPFIRLYENLGENGIAEKVELELPTFENITGTAETDLMHIKIQDINKDGTVELLVEHAFAEDCGSWLHLINCVYDYQFHILDYDIENKKFIASEEYDSWLHNYTIQQDYRSYNELYDEAFLIQFGHQNEDSNLDVLSVNVPQGKLLWHLGDGKGGFEVDQSQTVHSSSEYSTNKPALQLADVDKDGDLDIFVLLNTDTSSTLTVFKNETPVSINSSYVLGKMEITPNPVQGNSYVQLSLPKNQNLSKAIYNLFSIDGTKLITGNAESDRILIPGLPAGMYLFEVNVDGKNYIDKLILN